ncbi:MAG: hypothetical protein WC624_06295 [Candidatus Margulisiibacteriota bacterium]
MDGLLGAVLIPPNVKPAARTSIGAARENAQSAVATPALSEQGSGAFPNFVKLNPDNGLGLPVSNGQAPGSNGRVMGIASDCSNININGTPHDLVEPSFSDGKQGGPQRVDYKVSGKPDLIVSVFKTGENNHKIVITDMSVNGVSLGGTLARVRDVAGLNPPPQQGSAVNIVN